MCHVAQELLGWKCVSFSVSALQAAVFYLSKTLHSGVAVCQHPLQRHPFLAPRRGRCYACSDLPRWLLGNGDGTFGAAQDYAVSAISLVVGDFDGDGIPDLAVTTGGSDSVSILLGNGDGTFQAAQGYALSRGTPRSIATGDFNGDGHL